ESGLGPAANGSGRTGDCQPRAGAALPQLPTATADRRRPLALLATALNAGAPVRPASVRLLLRHRHGERHHVAATLGLTDLGRAQALHLVDADDRVHRHEAAYNPLELRLELLLAGVDHQLATLAEDELLHFQKTPQIALVDLLGIHLVYLALVEENHLVDGIALPHGDSKSGITVLAV